LIKDAEEDDGHLFRGNSNLRLEQEEMLQ